MNTTTPITTETFTTPSGTTFDVFAMDADDMDVAHASGVAVQWNVWLTRWDTRTGVDTYGYYVLTTSFDGPISYGAGRHRVMCVTPASTDNYRAILDIMAAMAVDDLAANTDNSQSAPSFDIGRVMVPGMAPRHAA